MKFNLKEILLFFILCLFLGISGCTSGIEFFPSELSTAVVGQEYYVEIEIKGGNPVVSRSFYSKITPENGLKIEPVNLEEPCPYNRLKIFGTPKYTGNIEIMISGATYGTNFIGSEFKKTYTIRVKEVEKQMVK